MVGKWYRGNGGGRGSVEWKKLGTVVVCSELKGRTGFGLRKSGHLL